MKTKQKTHTIQLKKVDTNQSSEQRLGSKISERIYERGIITTAELCGYPDDPTIVKSLMAKAATTTQEKMVHKCFFEVTQCMNQVLTDVINAGAEMEKEYLTKLQKSMFGTVNVLCGIFNDTDRCIRDAHRGTLVVIIKHNKMTKKFEILPGNEFIDEKFVDLLDNSELFKNLK
jgi:hypothetical protein